MLSFISDLCFPSRDLSPHYSQRRPQGAVERTGGDAIQAKGPQRSDARVKCKLLPNTACILYWRWRIYKPGVPPIKPIRGETNDGLVFLLDSVRFPWFLIL